MRYTPNTDDELFASIETVVTGLGLGLVELSFSRLKSGVQVRAVVCRGVSRFCENGLADGAAGGFVEEPAVSIADCAQTHRAILPRLELTFPKQELHIEVSSPGIERKIKDGSEFVHYLGRPVSCYRTDISGWTSGILMSAGDTDIAIKGKNGMTRLSYGVIAKARLTSFARIAAGEEEAAG
ncbi:MAG: ribosome assembly cofactor RimP [Treponema sp.]|jgi:ribosome maturation factor RimP|nr:ribosome assembly cofactor RimP [Treponema sp.]